MAKEEVPTACIKNNTTIDQAITFKAISSKDMAFLSSLYATTRWQEVLQAPWSHQQRVDFLQQQFDAQHTHYQSHYPNAEYLLIVKNNERIGRIYLDRDETSICLIDIALLPAFNKKGIGTRILKLVLNEAQNSHKKVVIHVEKYNPAYQWYIKHEFVQIEDKGVHQYMEWYPTQLD